jgi:hypothetical protein
LGSKNVVRTKAVALALAAAASLAVAGCGVAADEAGNNAAVAPFNGESHSFYAAAGGPAAPSGTPPSTAVDAQGSAGNVTMAGSGATSNQTSPDARLREDLLGAEDAAYTASAYHSLTIGAPTGCISSLTSSATTGSTAQAGEAFFESPSTAPGGNAYPAASGGAPNNPLYLVELLARYPAPQAAVTAYNALVSGLHHCSSFGVDIEGSPVKVTDVRVSTSGPLGSPSTAFTANINYKGSDLHGIAAFGVVDNVVAMVDYNTAGAIDNAILSTYSQKAASAIRLHNKS